MASALFVVCALSVACLTARTEAETTASQAPTLPHVGPSLQSVLKLFNLLAKGNASTFLTAIPAWAANSSRPQTTTASASAVLTTNTSNPDISSNSTGTAPILTTNTANPETTRNSTKTSPILTANTSSPGTTRNSTKTSPILTANTSNPETTRNSTKTSPILTANTSSPETTRNSTKTSPILTANTSNPETTRNSTKTSPILTANTSSPETTRNSTITSPILTTDGAGPQTASGSTSIPPALTTETSSPETSSNGSTLKVNSSSPASARNTSRPEMNGNSSVPALATNQSTPASVRNSSRPETPNNTPTPALTTNHSGPLGGNRSRPEVTRTPDVKDNNAASTFPDNDYLGFSQQELDDALEAALARRRWRRRGFRIDEVECAGEDVCVLRLHSAFQKPKKTSRDFDVEREAGMCRNDDSESEETGCCENLMDRINSLHRESFPQNILEILREAKCSKLYCRRKDCEFIGCAVPDCETTSPSHSSTSDLSTSRTHSTGHPAAVTDDDDAPNVTVIVVSCLLAFLAGVGGAVLITCLLKRRRVAKASGDVPQSFSSTTFMTGKEGDETFYEELPDGSASGQKSGNESSGARMGSENEYTYIPEQVTATPPHHGTTENPAASTYNVPGDHLANRKLPCAPAPRAEQPALATRPGRQRMETATNLPAASYALATQPDKEASSVEKTPKSDGQYFILEEEGNSSAGSATASLREGTAQSSQPAFQSGALYSPLTRDARGGQGGEYTALGNDTAGVRDYLELLPEYSLQKPLD